jgi:SagB-type dehydrogenase family enzyme
MDQEKLNAYRYFLKDSIRKKIVFRHTDQNQQIPPPPIQKPVDDEATIIGLPDASEWQMIPSMDLADAIARRKSRRRYLDQPVLLEELAYLLWATQGLRESPVHGHAYRTVPSAGCRHSFETYLAVFNVKGLEPAMYRYLPVAHELALEFKDPLLDKKMIHASLGQAYPGRSAVTFVWTAVPYRMEWRYGLAAHKVIALDAGHVCQNLYLACEQIQCGTCAIAAYDQEEMDELLGVDGDEEFTIYLAPVGKV